MDRMLNKIMALLKSLIGSRSARHKGSGVPSGRLLEVRALFFFLLFLFLGAGRLDLDEKVGSLLLRFAQTRADLDSGRKKLTLDPSVG